MPTVLPLRPGNPRRLGRYRLIGRLGGLFDADGNPDSYLARSVEGEQVIVTLLGRQRAAGPAARDRFTAEALAARRVDPFCVTRILDAGVDADEPFLVSEYVPGPSLGEVAGGEGPLTGAALAGLAVGTVTGLAAIHQAGLVHGAFGPDHVVLSPEGPRLVHFSITPPYGQSTPAADMYAWALTMLYAAVGRPSVGPQDLTAVPQSLRGPVSACLAPDPATRPPARTVLTRLLERDDPSADLLAEGTRRARSAARNTARPAPRQPRRPGRKPRSHAVGWAAACVVCLLAIAAAGWFIVARPGRVHAGADSPNRPRGHTVPPALAGTWVGQVSQTSPALAVIVQVTLAEGSTSGTIAYPALGCSGSLRVTGVSETQLTFSQHITDGRQNCEDGLVTLAAQGPGQLSFSFRGGTGPVPAGLLSRVQPSASPSPS